MKHSFLLRVDDDYLIDLKKELGRLDLDDTVAILYLAEGLLGVYNLEGHDVIVLKIGEMKE